MSSLKWATQRIGCLAFLRASSIANSAPAFGRRDRAPSRAPNALSEGAAFAAAPDARVLVDLVALERLALLSRFAMREGVQLHRAQAPD